MFSYYESTTAKKGVTVSFSTLVSLIKDNPNKEIIKQLHREEYGSEAYSSIKTGMPVVSPHCRFKNDGPKKKDNIDGFSGYFYFDIDAKDIVGSIDDLRQKIISKYSQVICLLGKSIGGKGLFFYIKIQNPGILTEKNFAVVRDCIIKKYLLEIPIDIKCSNEN